MLVLVLIEELLLQKELLVLVTRFDVAQVITEGQGGGIQKRPAAPVCFWKCRVGKGRVLLMLEIFHRLWDRHVQQNLSEDGIP
jgi:hypothetical protein